MRQDNFRNRVKAVMAEKGITIGQLAKEVGLNANALQVYLQNGSTVPLTKRILIAEALKIDVQTGGTT